MRDGTKFCHKCGRAVEQDGGGKKNQDDEIDMPMDAIERNILSETAAEIKADRRAEGAPRRKPAPQSGASADVAERGTVTRQAARNVSERSESSRGASGQGKTARGAQERRTSPGNGSVRSSSEHSVPSRNAAPKRRGPEPEGRRRQPDPEPPRKKRASYREEEWEDDRWEDEDERWEDDDWGDDDWDDDEEGVDVITIMTAVLGCVLLVVVAVLGFNLYKQHVPKNYDQVAEKEEEEGDEEEQEESQEDGQDGSQELEEGDVNLTEEEQGGESFTLVVTHNVNIRDNPSTSGTNVLKVAQEGETYDCKGSAGDGDWYEIVLEDGSSGYVFKDYVTVQ